MLTFLLKNIVLPLAVDQVKKYIASSDSTKDDKILDIVQTGATYLAKKSNNTVDTVLADQLKDKKMKTLQKVI